MTTPGGKIPWASSPTISSVTGVDGAGSAMKVLPVSVARAPLWTRNYREASTFDHDGFVDDTLTADGLRSVLGIR